jgi:hypothetical protein
MSTNGIPTATTATQPEQLALLSAAEIPLQFRLDERSRRSGLAHVAALRALVAAQAARRNLSPEGKRQTGRQIAA